MNIKTMYKIKSIEHASYDAYLEIMGRAFHQIGMHTEEGRKKYKDLFELTEHYKFGTKFYGVFKDEILTGGFRMIDFTMNFHGSEILVGGLSGVIVDMPYKKEKIAREMVQYCYFHYLEKNAGLVALYSFRPSFYKDMGFCWGNFSRVYRFKPSSIRVTADKSNIRMLNKEEVGEVRDCCNRIMLKKHGVMKRSPYEFQRMLKLMPHYFAGYYRDEILAGYLIYNFTETAPGKFDLHVLELVYEDREVFLAFMSFLSSQSDQFEYIMMDSQDEDFAHLLHNPVTGNTSLIRSHHHTFSGELGIMYRVINTKLAFEILQNRTFPTTDMKLTANVIDDMIPENNGTTSLTFIGGKLKIDAIKQPDNEIPEVEITLNVSELTAWLMGVISLKKLYIYGLMEISVLSHLDVIDSLFTFDEKPVCLTRF